jgi:hypothetical protein
MLHPLAFPFPFVSVSSFPYSFTSLLLARASIPLPSQSPPFACILSSPSGYEIGKDNHGNSCLNLIPGGSHEDLYELRHADAGRGGFFWK